jgi:hypothetical protein
VISCLEWAKHFNITGMKLAGTIEEKCSTFVSK